MLRKLISVLAVGSFQLLQSPIALGEADMNLLLGAGAPGTESFELGVGITSLIKVRLLPRDGIDLTLLTRTDQPFAAGDFVIADPGQLNTVNSESGVSRSIEAPAELRSIMAFKPSDAGSSPALELVARSDVPDEAVYLITKAILENSVFLEDLNLRSWDLNVDRVLVGLSLPLHTGAIRYYEEVGEANLSVNAAVAPANLAQDLGARPTYDSTFFLDFNADTLTLNGQAQRKIAEACQFATIFDALEIKVSSPRSSNDTGASDADILAEERIRSVMDALRSNDGCEETLEIIAVDNPSLYSAIASSTGQSGRVELVITLPQ